MSKFYQKFTLKVVKNGREHLREDEYRYVTNGKIGTPSDAVELTAKILQDEPEEVLIVLCLDTKNKIIGFSEVSRGALNSSIVHPREVFKRAIACNAACIIIAHNHPSGDSRPSNEDLNISRRLKECGKLLGIEMLDSLIIGDGEYTSLKEEGEL